MTGGNGFVNHYAALQVDPDCDAKALEAAYHRLAKRYHPDRTGNEDATAFSEVTEAYRVLRDEERRAAFDEEYAEIVGTHLFRGRSGSVPGHDDDFAADDADDHARILLYLYKKRREDAQQAGVIGYYLQEMLQCSDEHFEFHKWYLKEKGLIATNEQGQLAITIQGVDHVITMSHASRAKKLLSDQSGGAVEP